jgi:hypothetical protein
MYMMMSALFIMEILSLILIQKYETVKNTLRGEDKNAPA